MLKTLRLVVTESSRDALALAAASAISLRDHAHRKVICFGVEPIPYQASAMEMPPVALERSAAKARKQAEALARLGASNLAD